MRSAQRGRAGCGCCWHLLPPGREPLINEKRATSSKACAGQAETLYMRAWGQVVRGDPGGCRWETTGPPTGEMNTRRPGPGRGCLSVTRLVTQRWGPRPRLPAAVGAGTIHVGDCAGTYLTQRHGPRLWCEWESACTPFPVREEGAARARVRLTLRRHAHRGGSTSAWVSP